MDDETRQTIRRLEERVKALERKLDDLGNKEPDSFVEDSLTGPPKEIFRLLVMHLDAAIPGIADELRESAETVGIGTIEAAANELPEFKKLAEWQKARYRDIIEEMLPPLAEELPRS